jgi:hypothetical protein
MTDVAFDAVWTHYERASLSRRYRVGTFVAVIDEAVIEWGPDEDEVRERGGLPMGEPVYVGRVSSDPEPDFRANRAAADIEYEAYDAARDRRRNRRRFPMDRALEKIAELRLIGERTEYYGGCFVDGGEEHRFSDHDYRLLIEHGSVPIDTVLVAGIVFWKRPQ